ncbi:WD40/YVTN/BNR-like repeat-containing protein [Thermogemmatispora tikiterensis]|uniref:Sialidase domain-containing protein n=1 Tax=Thermogemmatispora tikiterensis TaxID=1825093 RepID=A0A328VH10_9CHLR|nr:YCF48-related protein [Thermogemmatispora tikiterensis]RAQ97228.1 hypothetical protein A4R35_16940 [Thermogemmatispora tikiterensis]
MAEAAAYGDVQRRQGPQRWQVSPQWLVLAALFLLALGSGCLPLGGTPPSPTSPALNAAAQQMQALLMCDERHGWASTQRSVLRTSDGGVHWQDVTPQPEAGSVPREPVERIVAAYLNAQTAWVALIFQGGSTTPIYHTSDGGRSWQRTDVPAPGIGVVQLTFVDALHGWLLVNLGIATNAEAVAIWRTTDGGSHWQRIMQVSAAQARTAQSSTTLPYSGSKSGLAFLNTTTGWATGSEPALNRAWLYVTHDGGQSWQPQSLPLPTGSEKAQIATLPPRFFSDRDGLLPVNVYAAGKASLYFYVTHDGGKSWRFGQALPASVIAWSFVSANIGYATDRTTLYVTHDGGQHWSQQLPTGPFADVIQLDFLTASTGWALCLAPPAQTHILRTNDAGQSWQQLS